MINRFLSSGDADIIVHNLSTREDIKINSHQKGVSTFALSNDDSHICFVDVAGKVFINRFSENGFGVNDQVYTASGMISQKAVRSRKCKLSWNDASTDKMVAVPSTKGMCVVLYQAEGDKWELKNVFEPSEAPNSHAEKDLQMTCFSPDGKCLATVDVEGNIVVWVVKTIDSKPDAIAVGKYTPTTATKLLDVVWDGQDDGYHLVAASENGHCRIENVVVEADFKKIVEEEVTEAENEASATADNSTMEVVEKEPSQFKRLSKKASTAANDDDDDDAIFNEDDSPSTTTKDDVPISDASKGAPSGDDYAVSLNDIKNSVILDEEEKNTQEFRDDLDLRRENSGDYSAGMADLDERLVVLEKAKEKAFLTTQEPFQPSSSLNDDKSRRYLVYNSVGDVTIREDPDNGQNRIEIRFADTHSRNKQEAFAENLGYVMASLCDQGAVFATDLEYVDQETLQYRKPLGSKVYYKAFGGWLNNNEDFYIDLNEEEKALCVAVGCGWCAVATSAGYLRVFSSAGVQLHVYWLKGPVISMCGSGSQLAVFYNAGQPVDGTIRAHVDLYCISCDSPKANRCVVSDFSVPLSREGKLAWVGFDKDLHILTMIDSKGVMSMLMKPLGWQWVPVFDTERTKKTIDHEYWPVSVSARTSKYTFVLLNGESKPKVFPRPTTSQKDLYIPVAESKETKDANQQSHHLVYAQALLSHADNSKLEQDVFGLRAVDNLSDEDYEMRYEELQKEADKSVLKIFQSACRSENVTKAMDLCYKIRSDNGIEAGITLANNFGLTKVAEILDDIKSIRAEETKALEAAQQQEQYQDYEHGTNQYESYVQDESTPLYANAQDDQPDNYEEDYQGPAQDENYENNGATGALSRKASFKSVTPALGATEEDAPTFDNPFRKNASPERKKRNIGDLHHIAKELKSSPSPKLNKISRQSSFSESARKEKLARRSIL